MNSSEDMWGLEGGSSATQGRSRKGDAGVRAVVELVRSNDAVLLSYVEALLAGAEIRAYVFDTHMSVLDGSIWAIARRLMVEDADAPAARRLLIEVGLGHELYADGR